MSKVLVPLETGDLLSLEDAAKYVGCGRITLNRLAKDGLISFVQLDHRYYHKSDLDRLKKNHEKGMGYGTHFDKSSIPTPET